MERHTFFWSAVPRGQTHVASVPCTFHRTSKRQIVSTISYDLQTSTKFADVSIKHTSQAPKTLVQLMSHIRYLTVHRMLTVRTSDKCFMTNAILIVFSQNCILTPARLANSNWTRKTLLGFLWGRYIHRCLLYSLDHLLCMRTWGLND